MAKKLLALLVAVMMVMAIVPMHAFAAADAKTAPNPGHRDTSGGAAVDDFEPPAEGCARITLTVGDVWGDGSGYQMLLDADATAYGTVFPATGALSSSGDVPEATYAEFEYKIPENADGALTTENIVINNSITIEIPAGTYDWCITNPTPGDRMWIASEQGNVGGRADDYIFEEGYSYEFEVTLMGSNDGTDVTVTDPTGYTPEPPTPAVGFYFEDEAEVAEFTIINNDTSTYTWERVNSGAYEGSYCMRVHWQVTPSDWLITPAVELLPIDPSVTFYAKAHSGNYPETIKVYVGTAPEIDAMTQLGDEVTLTTAYMQYEFDLSDYAGQTIYFAIEYTADDAYYAYVDQIEFWGESGSEPNVIDSIAIDGFTVPAWGEHPDFNVEVPEDANYSVDYTAWTVVIDGNNETMISSDMFDSEEYSYFMSIRLVPDEGYEFEDLPEVTINGDPSLVNYAHTNGDGELLVYSIEFTVEEPVAQTDPITTIEINGFVEPEWGANPFYGVTVPEDAHYSKIQGLWYRYNASGPMNPDDTFNDPDEQYYMYFFFVPMEGYEFADDVTVLINGSAALVFFSTAENGGISVYTNYFTVTEPSAGDLDEALNAEGGELHFETSEDYPWETFTDGDRLAAWSTNKGVSSSTSAVWTTVTANAGDVLNFDFMAWGEGTGGEVGISSVWDKCEFYVDEELVLRVGALQDDWTTYTYTFTSSGEHTLTWQYVKDGSVNPTGDYFAIDEVELVAGEEPPVEPTVIDTIEINGFVEPAWGEAPFYAVTVPEDAHYSIDYTDWNWYDAETEDGDIMGEGELFNNEGYVYYQYFEIIPEEGYVFADDVTILVNGDASVIETKGWSSNYGCEWAYTVDFTVEEGETPVEPTVVDTVYVNNFEVPPVAGENPLDHLNLVIPEGEPYTLDVSTWFNEESFSPQTDAFEEGHIYSVAFQVILPEGYEFASDVAIILDGGAVGVSEYVYNYANSRLPEGIHFAYKQKQITIPNEDLTTP